MCMFLIKKQTKYSLNLIIGVVLKILDQSAFSNSLKCADVKIFDKESLS